MTKNEFITAGAKPLIPKYGKSEARKIARKVLKYILEHADPLDDIILYDLKCCPKCLSGAWLIEYTNRDITCFNCNTTYFVIE